jgi:hypothetical protein
MWSAMRKVAPVALAALAVAGALGAHSVKAQDNALPDGPGKAVLMDTCTSCHDTSVITAQRHTASEWNDVVTQMAGFGATVTDDQTKSIVAYLAAHYGNSNPGPQAVSAPPSPSAAAGS